MSRLIKSNTFSSPIKSHQVPPSLSHQTISSLIQFRQVSSYPIEPLQNPSSSSHQNSSSSIRVANRTFEAFVHTQHLNPTHVAQDLHPSLIEDMRSQTIRAYAVTFIIQLVSQCNFPGRTNGFQTKLICTFLAHKLAGTSLTRQDFSCSFAAACVY